MNDGTNDSDILACLTSPDQQERLRGIDLLVPRHGDFVMRFLMGHTADRSLIEELTQQTFVRFFTAQVRDRPFSTTCRLTTVLATIARRLWYDHFRKVIAREAELTEDSKINMSAETKYQPDECLKAKEIIQLLVAFPSTLNSQRKKQVAEYWTQNFEAEKTHANMADEFNEIFHENISPNTLKNELCRVRALFKHFLRNQGFEI